VTALLLVLVGSGDWSGAGRCGEPFAQANAAYEAGQYRQAVACYDSAAAAGQSAAVYFNRGNAFFKQGMVGRAIADYLRAEVLNPLDRDIRHNLEFARRFRPDKGTLVPNPLVQAGTRLLRLIPGRLAKLGAGVLFLLAAVALSGLFITGRRQFGWLALAIGALFLYFLAAQTSWAAVTSPSRAVVIVPELVLRAGPAAEYKEIVIVHDGLEVTIRERRPEWVLIQVPGGEGGWVEASTIEQVFGPGTSRVGRVGPGTGRVGR